MSNSCIDTQKIIQNILQHPIETPEKPTNVSTTGPKSEEKKVALGKDSNRNPENCSLNTYLERLQPPLKRQRTSSNQNELATEFEEQFIRD